VTRAAARLLAARRPAGAAEALLGYLPFAEEDAAGDIEAALAAVGVPDGRPDPALLRALGDPSPARRAAAAEILCRHGRAAAAARRSTPPSARCLKTPGPRCGCAPPWGWPAPTTPRRSPSSSACWPTPPRASARRRKRAWPAWPASGPWPRRRATTRSPAG